MRSVPGRLWRALLDPQPQAVAGQDRHLGVVRRKDHVQPEPQRLGEERQVVPQLLRRQPDFGADFRAVFPSWHSPCYGGMVIARLGDLQAGHESGFKRSGIGRVRKLV